MSSEYAFSKDDPVEVANQAAQGKDWEEKLVLHHVFKLPRERYYGTLGLELTAQPVGKHIGNGCYLR